MRDEQIMKIEDLTEHIESRFKPYDKRHQLFFRGQLHKYDMEPTIYRNGGKYFSEESKLCDENFENGKTDIQNLAHMQHYGIKTRLLDMMTDPLVALYFAVSSNEREDASVYVFIRNSVPLESEAVRINAFIATKKERSLDYLYNSYKHKYSSDIEKDNFEKLATETLFIEPGTIVDEENQRMSAQKGTFAIPGNILNNGVMVGLNTFEKDESYEEIIVPFEYHDSIRDELEKRGYSAAELFLDEKTKKRVEVKDAYHIVKDDNFKTGMGRVRKLTIEVDQLLSCDEIRKYGWKLAKSSFADRIVILFRRPNSSDGNNIVKQEWCKKKKLKEFKILLKNLNIYDDPWYLDEHWGESNLVFQDIDNHPEKCKKVRNKLDISPNAMKVSVTAKRNKTGVDISTNLIDGTMLLVSCGNLEKSLIVNNGACEFEMAKMPERFKLMITMPVPMVQSQEIRDRYGLEYEYLKGDFIKRSGNDFPIIHGYKEFDL